MSRFSQFGNDLYTGRRSIDFVGRIKLWLGVSAALLVVVLSGLGLRGLNLGIEFTGGSDFRVVNVADTTDYAARAGEVISKAGGAEKPSVTLVGGDDVRIQTGRFDDRKTSDVTAALAKEFKVPAEQVRSSVVGPSWGASVSQKALQALVWFLVLVAILLAVYFRTWKMSFAALVALAHDIVLTVGVYSLLGLEVTPASMIGFLTILGYSLYDTVVVFDKVRENTEQAVSSGRMTYSQAANTAVNQTLVRSINTSVVALLPVGAILVMGVVVIGPGTLLDLALALFIGIAVGTYSSIFIATPLLAWLREREPGMRKLAHRVERSTQRQAARATTDEAPVPAAAGPASTAPARPRAAADDDTPQTLTGRPLHPSLRADTGPRNQPKRTPRSKR